MAHRSGCVSGVSLATFAVRPQATLDEPSATSFQPVPPRACGRWSDVVCPLLVYEVSASDDRRIGSQMNPQRRASTTYFPMVKGRSVAGLQLGKPAPKISARKAGLPTLESSQDPQMSSRYWADRDIGPTLDILNCRLAVAERQIGDIAE